jgi:hypothetical protein
MKRNIYLLILLLTSIVFTNCKEDDIQYEDDFDQSFAKWMSFKETIGNSYNYTVYNSSWVGISWQTTIKVNNGVVTERSFKSISTQGLVYVPLENKEWIEAANELNSHQNSGAADVLTLDQIYDKARTEWLIKREKATIYFEAKNDGMLSSCGYVPDGCMDDCFVGVHINSIKPGL